LVGVAKAKEEYDTALAVETRVGKEGGFREGRAETRDGIIQECSGWVVDGW
jgi:hypothetical protein